MGWISSGTATLEAALFDLPQVVCYKGNALSFQIAQRLVNVEYISLVNLIANEKLITELIQNDFSGNNLINEGKRLISKSSYLRTRYSTKVISKLGDGKTSEQVADFILSL